MAAPLVGRRVRLRPVEPEDHAFIRQLETAPLALQNYRQRAVLTPPEQYVAGLWSGVLVQFVVDRLDAERAAPIGLVVAYGADLRNGHCALAVVVHQEFWGLGWHLEAVEMLIDYLFVNFPFRKLYAEVLEPNLARFGVLAGGLFTVEGRLREHEFADGRWVDHVSLALYRDTWAFRKRSDAAQVLESRNPTPDELSTLIADRLSLPRDQPIELDSMALYEAIAVLDEKFPEHAPSDSQLADVRTVDQLIALWADPEGAS